MPIYPESLAPGIYIEEVTSLPHPIQCVSTGAAGLSGLAPRAAVPAAITDFAKYPPAVGNAVSMYLPLAGGIKLLHLFPAQGNLIWGARTTSQDTEWQFINVRRLAVRIAQSLNQRLQWAVFQPNDSYLWGRVINTVGNFMQGIFQEGALPGKKQHEAYFVKCDSTTMTQNDIDSGRVVIIVGFAPVRPAEFIVLQITVQTKKK